MIASAFSFNQYAEFVESWWATYHGGSLPKRMQAQNGICVLEGAEVYAVAYLYPTVGSEICYMGFTVRNPEISHIKAGRALKLLLAKAEEVSRALGYSILHTTFETESLRKLVRKAGYQDCAHTQILVKDLNGTTGRTST